MTRNYDNTVISPIIVGSVFSQLGHQYPEIIGVNIVYLYNIYNNIITSNTGQCWPTHVKLPQKELDKFQSFRS